MENEEIENVDSQNDTEATENATEEEVEYTESEGTEIDLEAEIKKATAPLYARMKQAEQEARDLKSRLSQGSGSVAKATDGVDEDMYALLEAKVAREDIKEVSDYAKLKNISISEALKSTVVKAILSEKADNRRVASAANTGSSKRGSGKVSDDILLENFKRGIAPESDEDIARIVELRNKR